MALETTLECGTFTNYHFLIGNTLYIQRVFRSYIQPLQFISSFKKSISITLPFDTYNSENILLNKYKIFKLLVCACIIDKMVEKVVKRMTA